MARGERAGAGGRNQLARLLAEIGVASDTEARAVISDILNQQFIKEILMSLQFYKKK